MSEGWCAEVVALISTAEADPSEIIRFCNSPRLNTYLNCPLPVMLCLLYSWRRRRHDGHHLEALPYEAQVRSVKKLINFLTSANPAVRKVAVTLLEDLQIPLFDCKDEALQV